MAPEQAAGPCRGALRPQRHRPRDVRLDKAIRERGDASQEPKKSPGCFAPGVFIGRLSPYDSSTPPCIGCATGCEPVCVTCASRIGLSTNQARSAAAAFITAATTKTVCQLPFAATSTLARGTSNDAVPFAVLSQAAFVV